MLQRNGWLLAGAMASAFIAGHVAWAMSARRLASAMAPRAASVECLGDAGAPAVAVYLHGVDSLGPAWVEMQNREALRVLARTSTLRIALPRAPTRRWPHDTPAERDAAWALVEDAAQECGADGRPLGLIGFSNGASLAADLLQSQTRDSVPWVVIASGPVTFRKDAPRDVATHPRVGLLAGTHDPHAVEELEAARAAFLRRGTAASLVSFRGGHRLPVRELSDLVARLSSEADAP